MAENVIAGDLVDVEWSADDVDANYEIVTGCKTVGIPEETPEYRDRTSLDSPGRSREYGVGLTETSELTLSCFYSPDLYEKALQFKQAGQPVYFRVSLPPVEGQQTSGDVFKYRAFVSPAIPEADHEGDLMCDIKLRPTGVIEWTKGGNT